MPLFGLIGFPLGHSFSRGYFTEKFERMGLAPRFEYQNFPLEDIRGFPALLEAQPALVGLNVTIPHKRAVMDYLDELDPLARAIGAVNTITIEPNTRRAKGYNTDAHGFWQALRPFGPLPRKALVLGTGGASLAVAFKLRAEGIEPRLVSRAPSADGLAYAQADQLLPTHGLVVNCTPLGTFPKTGECPPIDYARLGPGHICYDLVYNPERSLFLQKAEQAGARVLNGLPMLVGQAEEAWRVWTDALSL